MLSINDAGGVGAPFGPMIVYCPTPTVTVWFVRLVTFTDPPFEAMPVKSSPFWKNVHTMYSVPRAAATALGVRISNRELVAA